MLRIKVSDAKGGKLRLMFVMVAVVGTIAGCAKPSPPVALTVGGHQVTAEVAVTESEQALGLMNRTSLAFIDKDGTIVSAADMEPRTDDQHCAARPVSFVLEVPKGFLAPSGFHH